MIDLAILATFVLYAVGVGLVHRRRASRNLEEYFLAGRSLAGWKAGMSMAATQYASDTPLLVAGLIATAGLFSLWRLWVYGIAFLMMGFVLSGAWRRARVLTDAELTEVRYGGSRAYGLRILKAVHFGTVINCTVLAMVLIAAGRIAEPFLTWHLWLPAGWMEPAARWLEQTGFSLTTLPPGHPEAWISSADNLLSIVLVAAFTWAYSTTGGLRSVVSTDVVQLVVMLAATACYAWAVLARVGGPGALSERLTRLYGADAAGGLLSFGPAAWDQAAGLFCAVLAVQWFAQVNADGTGYLAQRSMACRSDADAQAAAVTFSFVQIVLRSLLWLPIILGLLVIYPAEPLPVFGTAPEAFRVEREALFAVGIRDILPAGMRGLMLTGMLAALASTVDTHLNWGASYWTNDLYKRGLMESVFRRSPSSRELVWVARLSSVGILSVALWIAVRLASIQSAWHLSLLVGSGLGVVLILRWTWSRVSAVSELSALLASLALAPVLLFGFPGLPEGARLLWMTGLSTAAVIAATLLAPPESDGTLDAFYARARPCGFWSAVAERAGEDPSEPLSRLRRAAGATALASASLFGLLVGLGGWMTRGFSPGRGLLIMAALLAIPLWSRLGFGEGRADARHFPG